MNLGSTLASRPNLISFSYDQTQKLLTIWKRNILESLELGYRSITRHNTFNLNKLADCYLPFTRVGNVFVVSVCMSVCLYVSIFWMSWQRKFDFLSAGRSWVFNWKAFLFLWWPFSIFAIHLWIGMLCRWRIAQDFLVFSLFAIWL